MHGETAPDFSADFAAEQVGQGLAAVDIEVIQYQMDSRGQRVLKSELEGHFGELEARTIRRGEGEVPTSLRLDRTEEVGGAATLVLVVLPGLSSGFGR